MTAPVLFDCGAIHPALAACRVEVARIRLHVANLGRPDDLVLGVALGDDVALGDVASTDPFPDQRIAIAEREKLQAHPAIIAPIANFRLRCQPR